MYRFSPNNDFRWTQVVGYSFDDLYLDVSAHGMIWTPHRHPPTGSGVSRNMATQAHPVSSFSDFNINIVKLVRWGENTML